MPGCLAEKMEIAFKAADASRINLLLEMMCELYAYDHSPFDERAALSALQQILADDSYGRVYLIWSGEMVVGYIVLTLGFSLEYHGRDAFVDEIYVKESHRGQGIGKRSLQFIEGVCRELGVKALHLEVERANARAQAVYRKEGFVAHDRYLMTRRFD